MFCSSPVRGISQHSAAIFEKMRGPMFKLLSDQIRTASKHRQSRDKKVEEKFSFHSWYNIVKRALCFICLSICKDLMSAYEIKAWLGLLHNQCNSFPFSRIFPDFSILKLPYSELKTARQELQRDADLWERYWSFPSTLLFCRVILILPYFFEGCCLA